MINMGMRKAHRIDGPVVKKIPIALLRLIAFALEHATIKQYTSLAGIDMSTACDGSSGPVKGYFHEEVPC
jgi:hypothetical protein